MVYTRLPVNMYFMHIIWVMVIDWTYRDGKLTILLVAVVLNTYFELCCKQCVDIHYLSMIFIACYRNVSNVIYLLITTIPLGISATQNELPYAYN